MAALPVLWRSSARDDVREIVAYIASRNVLAARRLRQRIEDSVLRVTEYPYLYRQSDRVPGLREIVAHPNYLVLYRVTATHVEVVNVVHARRAFPGGEGASDPAP